MDTKLLNNIGLTKTEIDTYIDLTKNGESSAAQIANRVNTSRTYVYDSLKNLVKKGLIGYVLKNNRKKFRSLDTSKLLELIENKKKELEEQKKEALTLIEEIKKNQVKETTAPRVEILEGPEGLKTILNDIVKEGKDAFSWGATEKIKKYLPEWIIKKYVKEKAKKGIKTIQLHTKEDIPLEGKGYKNKTIKLEQSSPSSTTLGVYGDKIVIFFWSEIPVAIRIENKEIAKSFRDHIKYLWENV